MPEPNKPAPFNQLSIAETDVINELLAGHRMKDIGIKLGRTASTVSEQKRTAYKKLGVKTDVDVTKLAIRSGYIQL